MMKEILVRRECYPIIVISDAIHNCFLAVPEHEECIRPERPIILSENLRDMNRPLPNWLRRAMPNLFSVLYAKELLQKSEEEKYETAMDEYYIQRERVRQQTSSYKVAEYRAKLIHGISQNTEIPNVIDDGQDVTRGRTEEAFFDLIKSYWPGALWNVNVNGTYPDFFLPIDTPIAIEIDEPYCKKQPKKSKQRGIYAKKSNQVCGIHYSGANRSQDYMRATYGVTTIRFSESQIALDSNYCISVIQKVIISLCFGVHYINVWKDFIVPQPSLHQTTMLASRHFRSVYLEALSSSDNKESIKVQTNSILKQVFGWEVKKGEDGLYPIERVEMKHYRLRNITV